MYVCINHCKFMCVYVFLLFFFLWGGGGAGGRTCCYQIFNLLIFIETPLGQLPFLETKDGATIAQSNTIVRYIAREHGRCIYDHHHPHNHPT